jgi:gluconokinase
MKSHFILALDVGTSSVRAALYDFSGNILPETFVRNERSLNATNDGGAEIDVSEAFSQVENAIDACLTKSKKIKGEIEYVATSAFWHSLVGVDANSKPTTKVFGWAENRPAKYVSILRKKLDEKAVHNRTGARFHSSYWTAKLLWLRKDFSLIFAKTASWVSFSDFVAMKLFDSPATSVSMASGTGIFDVRKCVWDMELLKFLKIKKQNLPEIVAEDRQTFQLNKTYAKRWERLKNAKWLPAIGDGAANNVGAGCTQNAKAALMLGTSGALRVAYEGEPPREIPGGLWCYRVDRKQVVIGGALSDGGGLYQRLKENFKLTDGEIENEIAKRAPDAHGLTFLPFFAGERSTGYNEFARGAIIGLKNSTDGSEIIQAALESVAYRFAEIFDQLKTIVKIKEIIASGGAASPVWTQIVADVLAQNIMLSTEREASSRGAVLLALEAQCKIESIEDLKTPKGREIKFDKKRNAIYRKARERHEKFYDLLVNKL